MILRKLTRVKPQDGKFQTPTEPSNYQLMTPFAVVEDHCVIGKVLAMPYHFSVIRRTISILNL